MADKQVVLLTGASRGLGLAVLKLLLKGTDKTPAANVVTLSRSEPKELQQLQQDFPDALAVVKGNVTELSDNKRAVDEALQRWKRLDALILNAGIAEFARIENLVRASLTQSPETLLNTLNVNTVSLVTTIRAALPSLRERHGRVVFVSSGAAVGNYASWAPYKYVARLTQRLESGDELDCAHARERGARHCVVLGAPRRGGHGHADADPRLQNDEPGGALQVPRPAQGGQAAARRQACQCAGRACAAWLAHRSQEGRRAARQRRVCVVG